MTALEPPRIVLADANVLYSRVLRDYLLYAADEEVISVTWSPEILREMTEHLVENVAGFTHESGERLVTAMNRAFPYAETTPSDEARAAVAEAAVPDEDDRHVLAAAVAAEATVLCTSNVRDFPEEVTTPLGVHVMTPDALLARLVRQFPTTMHRVHATSVARLRGASDDSTIAALERAGAPRTAALVCELVQARSTSTSRPPP